MKRIRINRNSCKGSSLAEVLYIDKKEIDKPPVGKLNELYKHQTASRPIIEPTVCFYWVKSFCSFDPLKIASDWSNISQFLRLVRIFDRNTPIRNKNTFKTFFIILPE
jgi:hypothetical protein